MTTLVDQALKPHERTWIYSVSLGAVAMNVAITLFVGAWVLMLYAYIGFPALLALFAKFVGKEPVFTPADDKTELSESKLPRIAIIVAAFNEEAVIADKLKNTWALDYPADRIELWVGSDGSSDSTDSILRSCSDSRLRRLLFTERRGKISVLNDIMSQVDAEIVVMSDANTDLAPDAIRQLVKHFEDPFLGCVSGELSLTQNGGVSGEGLYWKYEGWIKRNESKLGFLIGCNGGIFAMRRELFTPLPSSTIVEDFVLTMSIVQRGYRVRFEPNAKATEPACPSSKAEMVRKIRIGAGGFQALGLTAAVLSPLHGFASFAYWGHKVLRWCVPFFFLTALAANIVLSHVPVFGVFLGLQTLGILVAILASVVPPTIKLPSWTRPVSYFFLMNYALFCGFFRFLFGTQRVTWEKAAQDDNLNLPSPNSFVWNNELGGEMVE